MRLVTPGAPEHPRSKLNLAADEIAAVHQDTEHDRGIEHFVASRRDSMHASGRSVVSRHSTQSRVIRCAGSAQPSRGFGATSASATAWRTSPAAGYFTKIL